MFTFDQTNLICIYNTGTRVGLISELAVMQTHLESEDAELAALTNFALSMLHAMSDENLDEFVLIPDLDDEGW